MYPANVLQHPVLKSLLKKTLHPNYLPTGQEDDSQALGTVLKTLLSQRSWTQNHMMQQATQLLTAARVYTQSLLSTSAQQYNMRMQALESRQKGEVTELGEGAQAEMEAKTTLQSAQAAATSSLASVKQHGFQVIRTIFQALRKPARNLLSGLICTLAGELKDRRLKHKRSVLSKTSLEPYRRIDLPTRGEVPGGGRLTCVDSQPLAGDSKGFGYAGGNNCGHLHVSITDEAHAAKLQAQGSNQSLYLFSEVTVSKAWDDKSLRWTQPSPQDQTMTKASYTILGDQYGLHSDRQEEVEGIKTKEWLESCPRSCPGCSNSPHDNNAVCHHENLNSMYPPSLPASLKSLKSSLWRPTIHSGAAILTLTDEGEVAAKWPYAWKQQIFRKSHTQGGFWNSNTAVGPYIQCGICTTSSCFSNAEGHKFRVYSKGGLSHGEICSKQDVLTEGASCVLQDATTQYCVSKQRAECIYIQYCQREDWNCDANNGWSDPIYDCTKLISNTGISGDEWCAQHLFS